MEVGGSKPLAPTSGRGGRSRRRLLPLLLIVSAALVVAWGVWTAATVLAAARDANAGRDAIERARATSAPADIVAGRPLPDLRLARSLLVRAHTRLRNPLLSPARLLPFLGRQIRSADALTGAAASVSLVAIDAITEGKSILTAPRRTGPQRVALLRRVAALAERSERQISTVTLGPSNGLIGRLRRAHDEFADQLASLRRTFRTGAEVGRAAASLLEGPRRTLVFAANNAEMRAGSGMFLSLGELATSRGTISLGRMMPWADVPVPPGVPVSGDLQARWGWAHPSSDWPSLMLSPDFSSSASVAARMWKAARGSTVDGVISIDPGGLRSILAATGPVTVGGRRIDSTDVERELLHDQYARFSGATGKNARREALGDITRAVMTALNAGRWDPAALMSGVAEAARGRHLMLWSSKPMDETAWTAARVAGRLRDSSMLVSVLNRGGNKLDWFLRVDTTLEFSEAGSETEGVLRVTLRNTTPAGEPLYVSGPNSEIANREGEYVGILAVTLPGFSGGGRIDGVKLLAVVGADGPTRVVGAPFRLMRGATRVFVVRFRLAGPGAEIIVEPSARIPAGTWRWGKESWSDSTEHAVRYVGYSSH